MTRLLALALAVVALAAVGCGGTSKDDYKGEIDKIGGTVDEQFTEIGRDIQASGGLQNAASDVRRGAEAFDAAAADLKEIDPPDDAADAHAKIVKGYELIANDFREAARAARANDTRSVLELFGNPDSNEGVKLIFEGREELRKAGYDVQD